MTLQSDDSSKTERERHGQERSPLSPVHSSSRLPLPASNLGCFVSTRTARFGLHDLMTAPQMLDLFRRFEIHRERWIKHLDENGTDNDDWKPTAEESGPREVLWELGWRLRFRGPNETQLALDAGLVPLMCRIMKFTLADNIRFAKYYSKRKEVWQDRSISDIKELREGELAINVLLEASRWPAGARAVASSPELLETIYAPDGGLLQLIGSAKIPFLCYGDGPGRHSCVLIDLLGRTLSVLLHERQKGDREIARQFAALLKERTTRLDGPKSPRSLVNLLQVFKADSAKSRPVFQDPLEVGFGAPFANKFVISCLTCLLTVSRAAISSPSCPSSSKASKRS